MPQPTTYTANVPRRVSRNAMRSRYLDPELTDGCELEHNPDKNPACELLADPAPAPVPAPAGAEPVGVLLPESEPGKAPVVVDAGTSDGARTIIQPFTGPRIEGQDFADDPLTLRGLLSLAEGWRDMEFDLDAKVKAWTDDSGFVRRLALIEDEPERAPSGFVVRIADTKPDGGGGPADEPPAPPVEPAQVVLRKPFTGAGKPASGSITVTPAPAPGGVSSQLAAAFGRGRARVPRG